MTSIRSAPPLFDTHGADGSRLYSFLSHVRMKKTPDFSLQVRGFGTDFKVADQQHFFELLKQSVFAEPPDHLGRIAREKMVFNRVVFLHVPMVKKLIIG